MSLIGSLFGKESLVGIDIGSHAIKMVQLETFRTGYRVVRAEMVRTPPGAVRDGQVVGAEAVSMAIGQLLESAGIAANAAVVAVAGPTVAVRQIRVPKSGVPALAKSIRYEAAKHLGNNVDESAVSYEVMGPSIDDPAQFETMLVATPRDLVEARVSAVAQAGLEPAAVDIEAFAAQRAVFELNPDEFEDDSLRALVDIGAGHTEVTLLSGNQFVLTRSVPIAGDTFTDAIKNHFRIDVAEAEERKHAIDMSLLLGAATDGEAYEAAKVVQAPVDELLREIRRSIQYFQSQASETGQPIHLSEILLCGGSAQLPGIADFVIARLGIPARVVDPFLSAALYVATPAESLVQDKGPALGLALGLALKEPMALLHGGKR
ncbi:MAG: type IV pilus assembly protein PilM [Armatimonadota bacterium]